MSKAMINLDWDIQISSFELFLSEQERARQTVQSYLTSVGLLREFLYGEGSLSKQKLIAFKEWLWERYKPATCNARIAGINAFLSFIGADHLRLKQFKHQLMMVRPVQKHLTKDEYKRLFEAALKKGKIRRKRPTVCGGMERIMGIEPTYPAWEAGVLPMNYIRISLCSIA